MMLSTLTVPIDLENIAWNLYIHFVLWVMVEFIGIYLAIPETKGPALEETAFIFDGPAAAVGNAADTLDGSKMTHYLEHAGAKELI